MALRPWISRGLGSLLGSLAVSCVAAVLRGLLQAGGDPQAASAVSGVLWVAMSVVGVLLCAQVVLISLEILRNPTPPPRTESNLPSD